MQKGALFFVHLATFSCLQDLIALLFSRDYNKGERSIAR